jgi:ferredoxin
MVLGTKLQRALGLPALHLRAEIERCRECGRCSRNCPMGLPVAEQLRTNRLNDPECILCGRCVDGCPTGTIGYGFGRVPKGGEARPVLCYGRTCFFRFLAR